VGHIKFNDVSLQYRPDTDTVLKDLSFEVEGGKKIGIVGRTGAGKSTMCLVMSRILELTKGAVEIDGIPSANVDLDKLRKSITVIP